MMTTDELQVYEAMDVASKIMQLQAERLAVPFDDSYKRGFYEGRILELTIGLPEHPDGLEFGCLCDDCRSY